MMASKQMHVILAIIVATVPAVTLAKEFVVGDDAGWTISFDYQAWAADKDFRVGDTLVFKYPVGAHNVFKVNGTAFQACAKPPLQEALTTGNDVIPLSTPGRKWYICGVGQHCAVGGQKLFITVQSDTQAPSMAPNGRTPAAESPSSANGILASGYQALVVSAVAVAAAVMIMV